MREFGGFELFGGGGAFVAGFGGCEGSCFGGAVVGLLSAAAEAVFGHSWAGHCVCVQVDLRRGEGCGQ